MGVSKTGSGAEKSGAGFALVKRTYLIKSLKTQFPKNPLTPKDSCCHHRHSGALCQCDFELFSVRLALMYWREGVCVHVCVTYVCIFIAGKMPFLQWTSVTHCSCPTSCYSDEHTHTHRHTD